MIVMRFDRSKKGSGWYSEHFNGKLFVEMESQVIASMSILKKQESGLL